MPAVVGDVFGLGDVYIRQVSPVTVGIDTSGNFITESGWSNLRSYGWFGGGGSPGVSTVNRIDFSNDTGTASVRGSLSSARYRLAATGNSNYGWFGGGQFFVSPTNVLRSTVDRIDFSNDSTTASVRGSLSSARERLSATGNSNYGWFGGGATVSTVDRIDFSNDSPIASVRGSLSSERYELAATGNSNFGWFGGGYNPALAPAALRIVSAVDRIDFSNDSATASVRGSLSSARERLSATGNSNYGWFGGGSPVGSTVDRIDFSNDSIAASARGNLSLTRQNLAATGNSNYGWFGGGFAPSISGPASTVERIDFSNDSATASPRGPLFETRQNLAATSGQAKGPAIRLQKAGNFGWFGGGSNYFFPQTPSQYYSSVDRIDFSNDSATASVRGPLSSARYGLGATGNSNFGWFGGGHLSPSYFSTVDRVNFSNDLASISTRGSLPTATFYPTATGNSNYGWFGGGNAPSITPSTLSTVTRINFLNDLTITLNRGSLNSSESRKSATGNSNYGWFNRGSFSSPSIIDRIDFSNDGISALSRGTLSFLDTAATGNSNYGWFGGGSPGPVSTVERIDFSNDSIASSPRGALTVAVRGLSATGNTNYGWFGGGYNSPGSTGKRSTVSRINFSNDSVTASPRGSLSAARYGLAATSNTPI